MVRYLGGNLDENASIKKGAVHTSIEMFKNDFFIAEAKRQIFKKTPYNTIHLRSHKQLASFVRLIPLQWNVINWLAS